MQQRPILELPGVAAGAVTKHRFVTYAMAQAVAGDVALGVADYDASAAGKPLNLIVMGTAKVEAGGAFAAGDLIQADAQGRAIVKAAGATNGRALQAAGAAGQFVEVLLIKS
jgi:hypothetical protein